jgi:DNA-binding transcriptional ArsR family regulator
MVERDDVEGAITLMDGLESLVCGEGSPCLDHDCSATTVESIGRVKAILGAYRGLRDRLGADPQALAAREGPTEAARPEAMEAALAPLSNAWRLRILMMLSGTERSMSEIARELGMRTGHLQFHIKKLREASYIVLDRKRRTYSLTTKGQRALHGAERLVSGL